MSVCAVMLVKDEADLIVYALEHLARQVDAIIVADNRSTDGTRELIEEWVSLHAPTPTMLVDDPEVGYYQSRKTTDLALRALEHGHQWVVPCDADEFWFATDGRSIRDFLAGQAPDVVIVAAPMYHHVPTPADDGRERNPFLRLGFRLRERGTLPKVACRLHPGLVIEQGNHSARVPAAGRPIEAGLAIRHFSWRSEEQLLRKLRNGSAAYAAYADRPEGMGEHWLAFGNPPDEARVREWFRTWALYENPRGRDDLIYDPAPWKEE